MHLPEFTSPHWFLLLTLLFFVVIIGRYLLIAGIFYIVFYLWQPAKWQQRKLNAKKYKRSQLKKEIGWSAVTAMVFAIAGSITVILYQLNFTQIYLDIRQFGLIYLPISLIISLLIHETYYYWIHRWMHRPRIFRLIHKVHHDSHITSPFTAFSFHPLEGLLQAIVLPLTLVVLPMHPYMILAQLVIMSLSSVVNHLDIEIYPASFQKHFLGKWLIGATHHSLHHKQYKYNYGLYFTFWDKWKQTESPFFEKLFSEKVKKQQPGAAG